MTSKFTIRPLRETDAESVQAVALASWQHTYGNIFDESFITRFVSQNYDPEQIKRIVPRIATGDQLFVVAEEASQLVGFCHLAKSDEAIQLLRIYIRPSHFRRGIGQAFLKQGEQFVRSHNFPYYFCYVHRENEIGITFYQKQGFIHHRHKDVSDEWYMEKWVNP